MSEATTPPQPSTEPPVLYCGNCGAPIPPKKHFCERCLAPASLATPTPPAPPAAETPPPARPAVAESPSGAVAAALPSAGVPAPPPAESPPPPAAAPPSVGGPALPTAQVPPAPVVPAAPPVPPVVPAPAPLPAYAGPYAPPAGRPQPLRWPWIVLLVLSIVMACPLLLVAFFVVLGSSGEDALVSLFCFIPALILIGTAILGGIMAFRKPQG